MHSARRGQLPGGVQARARELAIDGLVCDLDGVIYRGDQAIPGAPEAIESLEAELPVVFCTNHSRLTVEQYRRRLRSHGLSVAADAIVTSAVATGAALAERGLAGAQALVIGQDGVHEALARAGVEVARDPACGDVDLVVVGWDDRFDYQAMRRAAQAIRAGADFIATNDDGTLPRPDGLWPGTGAICAAIEVACGRAPEVIGKPHRPMMEVARARLRGASRIAIVGDSLDSDIHGGRLMGWSTVLVLTGVTTREAAAALAPPSDLILDSIADLPKLVRAAAGESL